jgi:hypothetical protein
MAKKIGSLIGTPIAQFLELVEEKENLSVRSARLIPLIKPGDEMALTSIFLSAIRLVKEFRDEIFKEVGLSRSGQVYVFTEISFKELNNEQPDGLIIVVGGGKIKDAALLEMKNKNSILKEDQVKAYLEVAKQYKINKFITVSNQFVSSPTQSPLNIKPPKAVSLFHLSWSYILTKAHILLFQDRPTIEDVDQVEIMREVVKYFEHDKSGVTGFTFMKKGWKVITDKIRSGSAIKKTDPELSETVTSWLEEERDMALMLSRELGVLVQSGIKKYKSDLKGRIDYESKSLIENGSLTSALQVKNAASDIRVTACFNTRIVQMEVFLTPPEDKTNRGKIGWVRNQIVNAEKRNPENFAKIQKELAVYIYVKRQRVPEKVTLDQIDDAWESLKNVDIKEFGIRQEKSLGRNFEGVQRVVTDIEDMLLNYYRGVVQYLKPWVKPAPKAQPKTGSKTLDNID